MARRAEVFACRVEDADFVRALAPDQPATIAIGQNWMNLDTGQTYPVHSIRSGLIRDLLVRLGSESYALLVSDRDLRARYVCVP